LRSSTKAILLLVGILVVLDVLLARDFGVSTDEYTQGVYAEQTVKAYVGAFDPLHSVADLRFYGPFFSVLTLIGTRFVEALPLGLEKFQARHLIYFLSFALGSVSVYYLLLRYTPWPAALTGTALFTSQPLLFGHGFINPKDVPMLGFFGASMTLGIYAVDGLCRSSGKGDRPRTGPPSDGSGDLDTFGNAPPVWRSWAVLGLLAGLLAASCIDLGITHWSLSASIQALRSVYEGSGPGFLNALFQRIAEDAAKTPLDAYLAKWLGAYVCLASLWLAVLILSMFWTIVQVTHRAGLPEIVHRHRDWMLLVVAATLLGMTISIRIGGLFAGVLVASLLVWRLGIRGLFPAALYSLVAVAVSMATWPFLWGDPLSRALASLRVMGNFPHETSVLYRGVSFSSTNLPPDYMVGLMLIQFTLPLFPLVVLGLIRLRPLHELRNIEGKEIWIIGLWFLLPMLFFVAVRPTLYGTFRQLLFITPPLFVFAGLGLDSIWQWIPKWGVQALVAVVILAPGAVGIVRLHPFEYVYYNALVGGTGGAYRSYEMDYWCTSLRQAALDLNDLASPNDDVAVLFRDTAQVAPFARPDLHVIHARTVDDILVAKPDKVLVCSPGFRFQHADEWKTLAEVSREGAVFSKVMQGPSQ
jgi:hypothetical protein